MTAADRPSVTDNARAEARCIVTKHPGYEYRKERGGDVCIGCGAKIYSLDDYGRHVAEVALAAGRAETTTEDRPPHFWDALFGRAETTTATDEDAVTELLRHRVERIGGRCACGERVLSPSDESIVRHSVQALRARGLLATART